MKFLDLEAAEVKALGDAGSFEGYASIFGNVDSGGDIIERGAFKQMVKTRDGKVLVLYQHSTRDPIGKAVVSQDSKGLAFNGTLDLNDATGRKAYGLMKSGILDGMSVGYDVLPGGATTGQGGVRHLTDLKLYEISPVTFGMNELARVEAVKASALGCETIAELESLMRDALMLPARKAKRVASAAWPIISGRDSHDDTKAAQLAASIDSLNSFLKELP